MGHTPGMTTPSLHDFARQFRFDPIPPEDWAQHLPASVHAAVQGHEVIVFACPDEVSDTAAFSARFGFGMEDCANTLILKFTKDQGEHYAAAVGLGSRRLDVNGAVKRALGAQRLTLAKREVATEITGMEFGGITAPGLPAGMRVLVDAAVAERPFVVMGAGIRQAKLLLSPGTLAKVATVEVAALALP